MMATDFKDIEILTRVFGGDEKIKKSLPKFQKKMKNVNNDDTVARYRTFEGLHQFIKESVIGGLYLFNFKELHSVHV